MTKKQAVSYWILTALFLLPMAGSGVPELLIGGPAATAATFVHLGYPLYLMRILGLAKVLGAVAIVTNRSRTLAEWAYAGFVFDLVAAVLSHLIAGDGVLVAAPATVLMFVLGSYRLHSKRTASAPG
jgi:hypothetical protein